MNKNDILKTLPPELRAKWALAEKEENLQHATAAFADMLDNVQQAVVMLVTVAWEEAATAEEKEDAVRAGAIVMTQVQQVKAVLGVVLPPQVRAPIFGSILGGMSKEVMRYDAWLRANLPEAAKTRAAHIAAERRATNVNAVFGAGDGFIVCPSCGGSGHGPDTINGTEVDQPQCGECAGAGRMARAS